MYLSMQSRQTSACICDCTCRQSHVVVALSLAEISKSQLCLQVSSNGVILLGEQASSFSPEQEPEAFPAPAPGILAPFWAHADYSSNGAGDVYYRVSESTVLLQRAVQDITQAYSQAAANPSKLVIVTWKNLRSPSDDNVSILLSRL